MCGLVGIYSSNMLTKHKDALSAMLYLDTWRGRDSTGVAAIRQNADTAILKSTVPGYEFVEGPRLHEHLKNTDFCWIGHNRYGTMGKNIKTNAHPFTIDDEDGACLIVGAHNGTLKNKHVLTDHNTFGTDSEALYHEIALNGVEEAVSKIEGAWALTYYDHIKEELRILRNKERPLVYAFEEGHKTLIWASEMWMIRVACARYDIKLEDDKVLSFNEDTLYSFPAPDKINDVLTMERKGGVVGKQAPTFFHDWNNRRWPGGISGTTKPQIPQTTQSSCGPSPAAVAAVAQAAGLTTQSGTAKNDSGVKLLTKSESSSTPTSSTLFADNKVRDILTAKKFKGFGGTLLSKKELEDQLENGCGWCELEFITSEDKFAWLAPSKPICHKCLVGKEEPLKNASNMIILH